MHVKCIYFVQSILHTINIFTISLENYWYKNKLNFISSSLLHNFLIFSFYLCLISPLVRIV